MKSIFVYSITTLNVGDDLFMKILFERYPTTRMVLYAPENYKTLFENYRNVIIVNESDKRVNRLIKISRLLHLPRTVFLYIYLFIKYKISLFLVIGGSLFMEGKSNMPATMKKMRLLKLLFPRMKVAVIGSNFGPCYSEEFYNEVKNSLRSADDVCFRDKTSYDTFSDLPNVRWGNDIVFHMQKQGLEG